MQCYYASGADFDVGYVGDDVSETFSYQLHSHDGTYEILYMEEGDASYWVEGTVYKMSPGDIVIARGDEMHLMRHHSSTFYKRLVINVNNDFFKNHSCLKYCKVFDERPVGVGNHFPAELVNESGLLDTLIRLKKYMAEGEKPLVTGMLMEALYILNSLPENTSDESGTVRDIVLFINENISQNLSLERLSEQFYISKYYLCRQFKKRMGISIGKYITRKRILLTRDIYAGGKSLTDACIAAGFGDYSSFYVAYKKLYNTSPKDILRQSLK